MALPLDKLQILRSHGEQHRGSQLINLASRALDVDSDAFEPLAGSASASYSATEEEVELRDTVG